MSLTFATLHHSTEDARFSSDYMTEMLLRVATPGEFTVSQGSFRFRDAKSPFEHEFRFGNHGHGQWAAVILLVHSESDKATVATLLVKDVNW